MAPGRRQAALGMILVLLYTLLLGLKDHLNSTHVVFLDLPHHLELLEIPSAATTRVTAAIITIVGLLLDDHFLHMLLLFICRLIQSLRFYR